MESLRNLPKTEQLFYVAKIIKDKSLALMKEKSASEEFIKNQMEINKNVDEYISCLGNVDAVSDDKFYEYLTKMLAKFHNAHLGVRYKKEVENRKYLNQHLLCLNNKVYEIGRASCRERVS